MGNFKRDKMKRFVAIITLCFSIICDISAQKSDSLVYSINTPISWNDFKGVPNNSDSIQKFKFDITINMIRTKVNFWTGYGTYDAYAVMFKDLSWVKPEFKKDQYLKYNQIHFDIAEFYARKLEKDLNATRINCGFSDKIDAFFKSYIKMMLEEQSRFNVETQNGNDTMAQNKWERLMKEKLKKQTNCPQ